MRKSQVFHWYTSGKSWDFRIYPRGDASVFSRRKSSEEVAISSRMCVTETLPAKPDS